ncbi:MAG: 4Fe-4S cluster-binding domain-containing protein [Ruthenibacterium sp.]
MLIVTNQCSLHCSYCYEKFKTNQEMTFSTARAIIDREMALEDGYTEIIFDFFGGEPFENFPIIQQIYDYLHSKKQSKKYLCFATTNGVRVHGKIKEWLRNNKDSFWCSLSIDGTPEMHNKNRSNSYADIDVDFFASTWPEQPAKMTVSRETLPYLAEGILFLQKKGLKVTSTFAQGIDWNHETDLALLERELKKLISFYLENPQCPLVSLLDYPVQNLCTQKQDNEKWCGCGEAMKAYSTDGTLYPCQCFTPLANSEEKMRELETLSFKSGEHLMDAECKECRYLAICPTCYGSNYISRGAMNLRDKSLCEFYSMCIDASIFLKANRIVERCKTANTLTSEEYFILKASRFAAQA